MSKWSAEAPSNIALIKYMGKKEGSGNHPSNPSLSYTLNNLRSLVEIEINLEAHTSLDVWEPLQKVLWMSPQLSETGKTKFLKHWSFLKDELGIKGCFKVKSANNFPPDCGIASSASSFAALTLCACKVAQSCGEKKALSLEAMARLSTKGSGSSCRSFFGPETWVQWEGSERIGQIKFPYKKWLHNVVIVSHLKKHVSSSQAHLHVQTSSLNQGRALRAKERMKRLQVALKSNDWPTAFEVTWAEFWDMHSLFETSHPSFGYMLGGSMDVLNRLRQFWRENKDGPLVTMDAGPNVHLLYREDQKEVQEQINQQLQGYKIL